MRRFAALGLSVACFTAVASARDYQFDAALLGGGVKQADLALLEQGLQQPGTYRLDVLLNGEQVDSRDITLRLVSRSDGTRELQPCLSTAQLLRWGVKVDAFPGLIQAEGSTTCVRLAAIPQAAVTADVAALQLRLDIPQAALQPHYGGLAPEALRDDGITAFLMNYSAGTSRTDGGGAVQSSSWAQLQPGLNAGPWRVRSSWNWQSGGRWQRAYSYAVRGLSRLKSRLSLGERTTPGDVFDGVPFTGVMLATDEAMIPAGERSFTPAVSGVARTRARIEVRQNGYLLKTLQVAPGPFDIQDLPAGSGGGDLQVTVHEADGHSQFFTVPWQTPAVALHAGYLKYSLAGGRYRPAGAEAVAAPLAQGTAMYGLPHGLTVYGGFQAAARYNSLSLGLGVSLGRWGAVSADTTTARSELTDGCRETGASWRMRYSSRLAATGTGFSLTSTQYASPGYRTLTEALNVRQKGDDRFQAVRGRQLRGRSTLSLSQSLGASGSLGLNLTRTRWRNGKGDDTGYGASWSTSLRGVSVSVNWQQNRLRSGCRDSTLNLWLSVPLGGSTNASWSLSAPSRGPRTQEAGLNGHSMDNRLNWDVRERYLTGVPAAQRSNSTLHLGWSGTYGQAEADYGYSPSGRNAGVGVSGGVIVHRHGVTLSQPLSETVALVSAPGAAGVNVSGWPGVRTDRGGYTAVSGLSSYRENTVSLDPTGLPDDAEVTQTDVRVVPTAGAVVMAKFSTRTGARALVTLHHPDGSPVAFASPVSAEGVDGSAGMAGAGGQAYLTGLPAKGILRVREGAVSCRASYRLQAEKSGAGLYVLSAVCR
ncbi:pilin outer membrane usher protein SafC [Pantoea ananatis]|uniref:fimbrial biogenesis outer membrane usher protein n=1 Tax=Pantoea ananas TaxID=553 RepID=UPI000DA6B8EE|nr:fimbrial biogenesis outer membrane usher protein [Pantoea ananatis]PZD63003.1 pilin outer membrane usher protein SafC [Pantoea ananatis]PZD64925.1 pilin outer membrane usher protein SafC [Pantoea ananatis]